MGVLKKDMEGRVCVCVGGCEIWVGEMVSGYRGFVNKGIGSGGVFVRGIEDNDGKVVGKLSGEVNEVISE